MKMPKSLNLLALFVVGYMALECFHGCSETDWQSNFPCGPKVLVFHAKWCQFCPTTEEINQLQMDFLGCEIIDIDIDVHPDVAKEYHVKSIPRYFLCDATGCRTTTKMTELRQWLKELSSP
jgi:thioredoxin 1